MSSTHESAEGTPQNKKSRRKSNEDEQSLPTQVTPDTNTEVSSSVRAEIELSGPLDEIIGYFNHGEDSEPETLEMTELTRDMQALVEAIHEKNGAIRSELAADTDLRVGEDHVRYMLELLRVYGFIDLDQNTWVPVTE